MASPWTPIVRRLVPWMRGLRREFHARPELANEERWTSARIVRALREIGVPPVRYRGFTGVSATIAPGLRGRVVALRADMDGLPVRERTGVAFASRRPGRMHACGHDVHLACLLGAARALVEQEEELSGPVRLVFQPAEEEGRTGGAGPFIARGVLERPRAQAVLGQHVEPALPVGVIATRPGPLMAGADWFDLVVRGRGGHAGYPHRGPDAVLVAAEIVAGLQALVSRVRDPAVPAVISVGSIHGGDRPNVLPEEVRLSGTVRSFDPALRRRLAQALPQRARGIARSLGATVRVEYRRGFPPVVNDERVTARLLEGWMEGFGRGRVRELAVPVFGSEDFSAYLQRRPGAFWFLGAGRPGGTFAEKHSPEFLPDERALSAGAEALLLATTAVQAEGGR